MFWLNSHWFIGKRTDYSTCNNPSPLSIWYCLLSPKSHGFKMCRGRLRSGRIYILKVRTWLLLRVRTWMFLMCDLCTAANLVLKSFPCPLSLSLEGCSPEQTPFNRGATGVIYSPSRKQSCAWLWYHSATTQADYPHDIVRIDRSFAALKHVMWG